MRAWKKGAVIGGIWSLIGYLAIIFNFAKSPTPIWLYLIALPNFIAEFLIKKISHDLSLIGIIPWTFIFLWLPFMIFGIWIGYLIGRLWEKNIRFTTASIGFYIGLLSIKFWNVTLDMGALAFIFIPLITYLGYWFGKKLDYKGDLK